MKKRERAVLWFMLTLAIAAFGANRVLHHDHVPPAVPKEAVRRLKGTLSSERDGIHPGWMQVTVIRVEGNSTPISPVGVVVYRTLFGIPVGKDTYESPIHLELHLGEWLLVWLGFLFTEAAAAAYLVWSWGWSSL